MPQPDLSQILTADGRDLTALAEKGELEPVHFRQKEIAACLAPIDRGESIALVGEPGVGKSAILRGVAQEMSARGRGRLIEISTAAVLAGTRYIGEWQSKLLGLAQAAQQSKAVLFFS